MHARTDKEVPQFKFRSVSGTHMDAFDLPFDHIWSTLYNNSFHDNIM